MQKVKNIYYTEKKTADTMTGLLIELEDGRFFKHLSTDVLMPFQQMKAEELINL